MGDASPPSADSLARDLKAARRELDALAYMVGHDLRAPLRAIEVLAEYTLKDYGPALDDEGRERLRSLVSSSKRASVIVEDVLAFARASHADVARERVDVSAVAEGIAQALASRDRARDVKAHVSPGIVAHADPRLARVVVEKLLENAWKFTRPVPGATIEVGASEGGFFVRDTGVGFDPREAPRLFRPFERLHSANAFEGVGLGLAIAARIVERHGGAVEADGRPGGGATFRVRFA